MSKKKTEFTKEPDDHIKFTEDLNKSYTKYAKLYDLTVKILPIWKTWIKKAIPHIQGTRVLEASFGTGYLISRYAGSYETYGLDYNQKMVEITQKNLDKKGIHAELVQGNVESMPYEDNFFDTIVNTMAFSGYPDADKAMSEFKRVLKKDGRLVLIDFEYPENNNSMGIKITKLMENGGDVIRDMSKVFEKYNFDYTEEEVGGFGSVHLYVAVNKK
ncbi:MAG: methyltransferase domain-containing protein [bacterium]|nr:methyltransferase domain-containing protein [bacterium]